MKATTLAAGLLLGLCPACAQTQAPVQGQQKSGPAIQSTEGVAMATTRPKLDDKMLAFAKEVISKHGDKIAPQVQQDILAQRVTLGMNPYEAYLAAGQFYYQVSTDLNVWSTNSDPFKVMWGQTAKPDNSEIWMTFRTATQFADKGFTVFKVYFKGGKALSIDIQEGQ